MHLEKIKGNSYYIPAPTNIGLFQFKDRYTLLIDTGNNRQEARKISEIVSNNNFNIKYIVNTHNHIDHSGGNTYFQENFPGSILYSSEGEKLFIENNYLFPMYLYGGNPIRELRKHLIANKKTNVDSILKSGSNKIHDEKFEIITLAGHASEQIAIASRDRVCYLGDSLFSQEIIAKYSFPFLLDIKAQFNSYELIKKLDYDYFVVSHSSQIYDSSEIKKLVQINYDNLEYYLDLSLELLLQPKTREDLLEEICILQDLDLDFKEYYFSLSTIAAIITYLFEEDKLNYQIENGKLFYYLK